MDYTAVKRTEPPVDDVREEKEGCFSRLRYRCGAFDQGRRQGCCWIVAFMVLTAIFGGLFNNKNNEDLPFFGEQNLTVPSSLFPLKIPLGDPLQIGQYYHIYGNVSKSATDFCFSLTQDVDVRLKICALFSNGTGENSTTTYQALRKNGTLINEISVNPFEKNEVFDLRIRFLDGLVQIFANHSEIGIFTASDALLNATEATLSTTSNGIQSLRLFRIEGRKYEESIQREHSSQFRATLGHFGSTNRE
ncbi:unnamed protein product, partial [Mesorhabditis belari]|uniref:Galectin n=1 Tax=Mesorhabditis belari TaxID=2138241 RepID=A0AAF3F8G7_9BILA